MTGGALVLGCGYGSFRECGGMARKGESMDSGGTFGMSEWMAVAGRGIWRGEIDGCPVVFTLIHISRSEIKELSRMRRGLLGNVLGQGLLTCGPAYAMLHLRQFYAKRRKLRERQHL